MNKWKEIWNAYHVNATKTKIALDMWRHVNIFDRLYILFLFIVFISSIFFFNSASVLWKTVLVISEVSLLFKLFSVKQSLILNEYGGSENTQAPPSNKNHQDTRYLLFKKTLSDKLIEKSHVEDCFDLVDCQIDIHSTQTSGFKKAAAFSLGLLAGLLAALWTQLDTSTLLYVSSGMISIAVFLYAIASSFPSAIEKRKELKYFMLLFCKEV